MSGVLFGSGGPSNPPSNPVNLFMMFGQSNSDESPIGITTTVMGGLGISNADFCESPFPGRAFTNWYGSGGFNTFSSDGTENPDSTVSVTSLSQSGGTATLQTAAGDLSDYATTNYIVVAGANESDYNDIFGRITKNSDQEITFSIDSGAPASATGTITVRRAGWREILQDKCEKLSAAGNYVNVIGIGFMQGEANVDNNGNEGQFDYFREFVQQSYEWCRGTLSQVDNTTVDRNFVFAAGLPAILPDKFDQGAFWDYQAGPYVRGKIINGCAARDYAYWVETLDYARSDGIHFGDFEGFVTRILTAVTQKQNVKGYSE